MKHPELSKHTGSLAHALTENKEAIDTMYMTASANQLKVFINDLVMNINQKEYKDKSEATKRFLKSLLQAKSKDSVITLVYNTMAAGDNLAAIH